MILKERQIFVLIHNLLKRVQQDLVLGQVELYNFTKIITKKCFWSFLIGLVLSAIEIVLECSEIQRLFKDFLEEFGVGRGFYFNI